MKSLVFWVEWLMVVRGDLPLSSSVALLVVEFGGEHGVHEEVFQTRATEFVQLFARQMDLEELLMLRLQLLLFGRHDLTFLFKLVLHEVLQLLPKVDFLGWVKIDS